MICSINRAIKNIEMKKNLEMKRELIFFIFMG